MNRVRRRSFLASSAAAGGILLLSPNRSKSAPSERVNLCVVGVRGRGMSLDRAFGLADGRVHVGQQAVNAKLVDGIKAFDAVLGGLVTANGDEPELVSKTQDPLAAAGIKQLNPRRGAKRISWKELYKRA